MKGKFKIAGLFILLIFDFFIIKGQNIGLPKEKITTHLSENCLFPGETLWLKIYVSNLDDLPAKQISRLAFVEFVDNQNTTLIRKKVILNEGIGNCSVTIPEDISTGICHVMVYTNWLKNFGEKSYSNSKVLVFNPQSELKETSGNFENISANIDNSMSSAIQSQKSVYHHRDKVEVDFNFESFDFQRANLSVSVKQKEPEQIKFLTGSIPEAIENSNQEIIYYPDYQGVLFSGRLLNKINSEPVAEKEIILTFPGEFVEIKYAKTNHKGEFRFLLEPKRGMTDLVLYLPNNLSMVKLDDPFVNGLKQFPEQITPEFDIATVNYLKDRYVVYQLRKRFAQKNTQIIDENNEYKDSDFFGEPYQTVKFSDYKTLDSISEYFYELIPTVHFTNKKGINQLYLTNPETNFKLGDNPVVFIDGVYYPGLNELASLDHNQVEEISVVPKNYYYRDKAYNGIVSVKTQNTNFNDVEQLENMVRLIYTISDTYLSFKQPDFVLAKSGQERFPDLRMLLYWEENLKYDKGNPTKIVFYTSDVSGDFVITVTGITDTGIVINQEKEITVIPE
jgi:hypothetical protein